MNWLLTGEGEMLRADRPAPGIDEHLLALCIQGILQANPGATPEHVARHAVEFYARFQSTQMKKPEAA